MTYANVVIIFVICVFLSACVNISSVKKNKGEFPVVIGPSISNNTTPVDDAILCVARKIQAKTSQQVGITVGNVKDYTGKYSEYEGGNAITQGGALMVISALGKFGNILALRERFDVKVAEIENQYSAQRRLGDGRKHVISVDGVKRQVPWLPETSGKVLKSEVYIVGGITELNYNIFSGGSGVQVHGIGPRARTFAVNVAVDLRLVNTTNLNVLKTISLQKQVLGYEVEAGVFNFFGTTLVDAEAGVKSQEPLQLAIRSVLEIGVVELISYIYSIDAKPCLKSVEDYHSSIKPPVSAIVAKKSVTKKNIRLHRRDFR